MQNHQATADALNLRFDGIQQLPFMPETAVFTRPTDGMTIYMPPDCTLSDVQARYAAKDKEGCELCGKLHGVAAFCAGCLSARVDAIGDICPDCQAYAENRCPPPNDPGLRCGCEDYPCCGH